MLKRLFNVMGKTSTALPPLPKGLEAAPPIKNKKRLARLMKDDSVASGGTNTVVGGQPLLGRRVVHH